MSWSPNLPSDEHMPVNPEITSTNAEAGLSSLYYLLLNGGNLQDTVRQQQEQLQTEQMQHQQQQLQGQQQQQEMQQQEQEDEVQDQELLSKNMGGGHEQEMRYKKTMSALEKAGLLDLTLKISDLIKQNESLQKDIDTLEHIVQTTYTVVMGK